MNDESTSRATSTNDNRLLGEVVSSQQHVLDDNDVMTGTGTTEHEPRAMMAWDAAASPTTLPFSSSLLHERLDETAALRPPTVEWTSTSHRAGFSMPPSSFATLPEQKDHHFQERFVDHQRPQPSLSQDFVMTASTVLLPSNKEQQQQTAAADEEEFPTFSLSNRRVVERGSGDSHMLDSSSLTIPTGLPTNNSVPALEETTTAASRVFGDTYSMARGAQMSSTATHTNLDTTNWLPQPPPIQNGATGREVSRTDLALAFAGPASSFGTTPTESSLEMASAAEASSVWHLSSSSSRGRNYNNQYTGELSSSLVHLSDVGNEEKNGPSLDSTGLATSSPPALNSSLPAATSWTTQSSMKPLDAIGTGVDSTTADQEEKKETRDEEQQEKPSSKGSSNNTKSSSTMSSSSSASATFISSTPFQQTYADLQQRASQLKNERARVREERAKIQTLESQHVMLQSEFTTWERQLAQAEMERHMAQHDYHEALFQVEQETKQSEDLQASIDEIQEQIRKEEERQETVLGMENRIVTNPDGQPQRDMGSSILDHIWRRKLYVEAMERRIHAQQEARQQHQDKLDWLVQQGKRMETQQQPQARAQAALWAQQEQCAQQETSRVVERVIPELQNLVREALEERGQLRQTLAQVQEENDNAQVLLEEAEEKFLSTS